MKILVTGGAGFIGGCLCKKLIGKGYDVISYDLKPTDICTSVKGNILDTEKLLKSIKKCDYIFHLAAVANTDIARAHPESALETNVAGTYQIAQCCERTHIPLSYASSVCVYGNTPEYPSNEDSLCLPTDLYGATKLIGEKIVKKTVSCYNILRFGTTYGPYMRESLAVHRFITQALKGEPLTIHGSGQQTRCMIYIDDLVEACCRVVEKEVTNRILNLATEEEFSALELAEMVCHVTGKPFDFIFVPDRPGQIMKEQINIGKATLLLKWMPKTKMRQGLEKTLEWMKK